uniref:C-type lectin domain-containing protein n=1 Tax=Cyanoderma ruficeps TaxID=181631 RepID=A0A8C3NTY8_9PASS
WAVQVLKARAGKSESLPRYGMNNTSSDISSERTASAVLLKSLMEELNVIYPPLVLENTFQTMVHKWGGIPSMVGAKGSPCPPTGTTCELCPPGWQLHRGRCYFFSEEAKSWEDSRKNCLARKSQLLVIEDEIEMVSFHWLGSAQCFSALWRHGEDPYPCNSNNPKHPSFRNQRSLLGVPSPPLQSCCASRVWLSGHHPSPHSEHHQDF